MPRIARRFAERLPKATLRVVSADYLAATDGLTTGDVDVAFTPEEAVQPGMRSTPMFVERGALLVRRDHAHVRRRMSASSSTRFRTSTCTWCSAAPEPDTVSRNAAGKKLV